nr:unknown [Ipomoea trifida]
MNIIWREDECVALEDHGEGYLHFKYGEIQANTFARASAESEVGHGVILGCISHPFCKSVWVEQVGVFSPYLWVMVDCQNWDVYLHSCWDCEFPNFGFPFRSSEKCEEAVSCLVSGKMECFAFVDDVLYGNAVFFVNMVVKFQK